MINENLLYMALFRFDTSALPCGLISQNYNFIANIIPNNKIGTLAWIFHITFRIRKLITEATRTSTINVYE